MIPSTKRPAAAARLLREIRNGLIRDRVDFDAAIRAPEYDELEPGDVEAALALLEDRVTT